MSTSLDEMRPTSLDEFVGQPKLKEILAVKIASSVVRDQPLDHMLFHGPPGSGKTSIANLIAIKREVDFLTFIMPLKKGMLQKIVSNCSGVVFLDEIHRASVGQQEELLPLIEDGYVQLNSGQRVYAENLTILAATTERDKIIKPLYQRFFAPPFEEYTLEEMSTIAVSMGSKINLEIDAETAAVYAKASAGVPRNVKEFVYMHRDLWYAYGIEPNAMQVLEACRVTEDGLTENHVLYLRTLENLGGIAGLKLMAGQMQLNEGTVQDLEQLLIKEQYVVPTKQGRELLSKGYLGGGNDIFK